MNRQCERVEPLVSEYALGELGSFDTELVEEHVRSCPRCSEAVGEAQRVVSALSQQEMVEPSEAVCDSVRKAIREKMLRRRKPYSAAAALAGLLVRRPLLAGASALVAVGAVALFLLMGGLRHPEVPPGHRRTWGGAVTIFTFERFSGYLSQTEELMRSLQGPDARKVLTTHDWMTWVAPAMKMKGIERFETYKPLFEDLESLYWEIEACEDEFGEEEISRISQIISERNIIEQTKEALDLQR
ncbi:zf-HC2 domain-containing protein [bacterium]|nr:zf-HC2 domain-containing protein [bacterium]